MSVPASIREMIVQALAGRPAPDGRRGRSWLVLEPESREAALVDPPHDRRGVRAFLEAHGASLRVIALTGNAPAGGRLLQELAESLGAARSVHLAPGGEAQGDALRLGRRELRPLSSPDGGTTLLAGPGCLFTGLALLAGEIPPEADAAVFRARAGWLRTTLAALPARTRIYPGHGPVTEVGLERTCNQELWG